MLLLVTGLVLVQSDGLLRQPVEVSDHADHGRPALVRPADPTDPALRHVLTHAAPAAPIEVMVQFMSGEAGLAERAVLVEHGMAPRLTGTLVPLWLASGTAPQIEALGQDERVRWVEWNAPLVAMMNLTKQIIGAQAVWDRTVLNDARAPDDDPAKRHITGSGVTIVVVDSGIDATHPDLDYTPQMPQNPSRPDADDKVIYNAKLDQGIGGATPTVAWIPMQNTDTTSGHGTHVAGTVAGSGHASAGDIVGVAPDAWLIGLSMGEAPFTFDEYSALEHTYALSTPGSETQQAWNIRVVTNSWGPGFPFDSMDPNDATVQVIERLAYDNGIAVIFANGNDGGEGGEGDDRSNIFAKVPAAIGVAASERNGVGMASFSSRGDRMVRDTWPDIAAPGVDIWSAAARASMIGGLDGATGSGELDYYYLAISGTSMATPHVAGLAALMFQAAPSLVMSEVDEDLDTDGEVTLVDPTGLAQPATAQRPIHEVEFILKLTANRITEGEFLADNHSLGLLDRPLDYAQGYGLVDADAAVALARAVQSLRDPDGDGSVDHPEITVLEAHGRLENIRFAGTETVTADVWRTQWSGDFVQFDGTNPQTGDHAREVWVPAGTTRVTLDLSEEGSSIWDPTLSNLQLAVDTDGDGTADITGTSIDESFDGGTDEAAWWQVRVTGIAIGGSPIGGPSTGGAEAPYAVDMEMELEPGAYRLDVEQARGWEPVNTGSGAANVVLDRTWYGHASLVHSEEDATGLGGLGAWMLDHPGMILSLVLVLALAVGMADERGRRVAFGLWGRVPNLFGHEDDDGILEAEVLEAELL